MKHLRWKIWLSLGLISLSAGLYFLHYYFFQDAHHIFIYLLGDIAFIPINVLLVVLVLHQIITSHEKQVMFKKLNMVFGAFFSELGTELFKDFSCFDSRPEELKLELLVKKEWTQKKFADLKKKLKNHRIEVDSRKGDLSKLRKLLVSKREFLLRLLENPNLLEHEEFTGLLWAVFHLSEELSFRGQVNNLPQADYEHLSGDIKRAYILLVGQWLSYMKHLHRDYPFLFSLAMRTNPFDPEACVVIK
ncbi:MAG: hypothetical protein NTY14_04675 [Candidatus Omnitrophica bacterium]|nr:hypothetical protein [Candidatus Omnitrophota bacterium]